MPNNTPNQEVEEIIKDAELRYRRAIDGSGVSEPYEFTRWLRSKFDFYVELKKQETYKEVLEMIDETMDLGALAAGTPEAEIHNMGWENCKHHLKDKLNSKLK